MIKKRIGLFLAQRFIHLHILSVDRRQQPFFEKSMVDDASAKWTGVDNN